MTADGTGRLRALDDAVVDVATEGTPWTRVAGELVRELRFPDFASALSYVNEVGRVADEAGHHPDVELRFGLVRLRLQTHSVGGLTDLDLDLARRIDALPAASPPER